MNIKKIGMTALAASLVSTSVFAGELTATGSASLTVENYSGEQVNAGKAFSMADSVILSGSTELDNGMTVSMSFELDDGADATPGSFDDHSVSISSDSLGTFKFSGNSGSSAVSAIDATAAGDVFDTFDGQIGTAETAIAAGDAAMLTSPGGANTMLYTLPELVDGLSVSASYTPQGATIGASSSSAYGLTYTGVEGLSVSYGAGSNDAANGTTLDADVTTMKASYAYGSVTVAYSDHEFDSSTATRDQDTTSYSIAYTVSDAISVTYGTEEMDSGETTTDAEYSKISASYTAGGLTVTAVSAEGENISYGTGSTEDQDYWGLTLGFAF
jgi:outer membrane protein OmpU